MKYLLDKATELVETETLRLAARNLKHFIRINNEDVTLDNIVTSIQKTIADTHSDNPEDMETILATQARILDATFMYFLEQAKKYSEDENAKMAFRAQHQTMQTIKTLKSLKTQKMAVQKNKERTEQKELDLLKNA